MSGQGLATIYTRESTEVCGVVRFVPSMGDCRACLTVIEVERKQGCAQEVQRCLFGGRISIAGSESEVLARWTFLCAERWHTIAATIWAARTKHVRKE